MTFIEDLSALGETLTSHELPNDVSKVVGAIVKVLEDTGLTVPAKLLPTPESAAETEIDSLKAQLAKLEAQQAAAPPAAPST